MSEPIWLTIARELQLSRRTGLTFTRTVSTSCATSGCASSRPQLVAEGASIQVDKVLDLMRGEMGYATPK